MSRKLTIWSLVLAAVLLGAAELWALVDPAAGDTISELVWEWTASNPSLAAFIGLAFGLVFAHFFWPRRSK